jgi:hypothetical protein
MMTSTRRQALQEMRDTVFWCCIALLVIAVAAFFIIVPMFIPVTSVDHLPAPEYWPEENPCLTPPQPYFDQ